MEIAELARSPQKEMSSGCPLWVVAQSGVSRLTRQLDWYLNFQIMKSECHRSPNIPAELSQIEDEWAIERETFTVPTSAPLLIPSYAFFPNTQTVVMSYDGDLSSWVERIFKLWQGLKMPNLRVFLPDGVAVENMKKQWQRHTSVDIEIVAEGALI